MEIIWFRSRFLCSWERQRLKGDVFGKHFERSVLQSAEWPCSPEKKEYPNQYCHSYSRENNKQAVLNFPHSGPKEIKVLKRTSVNLRIVSIRLPFYRCWRKTKTKKNRNTYFQWYPNCTPSVYPAEKTLSRKRRWRRLSRRVQLLQLSHKWVRHSHTWTCKRECANVRPRGSASGTLWSCKSVSPVRDSPRYLAPSAPPTGWPWLRFPAALGALRRRGSRIYHAL